MSKGQIFKTVNIVSDYDLVPSAKKPLPEPKFIQ